MRIFIHHDGALGDVVLSLPALRAIRKDKATLHFAGRADLGAFLRECGLVDEATSAGSSRYASLYAGRADDETAAFLRTFDQAFLFTVNGSSVIAASLSAVVPGTKVIITIPREARGMHIADFRASQIAGLAASDNRPGIPVPRQYQEMADALLVRSGYDGSTPVVAVHPGSGGTAKVWPLERFLEVIDRLKTADGPFVLILTGPAESDALKDRVEDYSRGRGVTHISDADLISVAALLNRSGLFIGNDSGVGHLAGAVGCPVLALFGPTDPALWAPRGTRVEVIRSRALADIDADRVYSRAAAMLHMGMP